MSQTALDTGRRRSRRLLSAFAATSLIAGLGVVAATSASAATVNVTDASFAWGLNGEQGGGAYAGGCNFLSAGVAGSTGSSRPWTQADGFYSTHDGNVTIEKPDATGTYAQPTWATKCQDPNGNAVSVGSATSLTGNRVEFGNGTGTVDPDGHTAHIQWIGSFTSVFYGGYTYWTATNPTLTVNADGTGTLTATASGYGADMNDPTVWLPLTPTTITLANLHGVTVTDTGFTVTPDYLGVAVTVPDGATPQVPQASGNPVTWGSFPQSFVDFQELTGQSSYWFTSGGARDAAKPTVPLTVAYTAEAVPTQTAPVVTTQPADASGVVGGTAIFTAIASGDPTPTVQWQLQAPGTTTWQDYPGATSTTFTLPLYAAGYDGTKVRAVFTNDAGSVTTDEVTLTVTTGTTPLASATETITTTVSATGTFALSVDPSQANVTLDTPTLGADGSYLETTGALGQVTVTDTRVNTAPGWTVSGQLSDFSNGADTVDGNSLGWTPTVVSQSDGQGVSAGNPVAAGVGLKTTAATLGTAPQGSGVGTAVLGADLDLRLPPATVPGTYTATLTLTAI